MEKKTMKTILRTVVVFTLMLVVASCLDDDSSPQYLELGTTELGPDDEPLVITDSENTLQLVNPPSNFDDSVRVLLRYSVEETGDENNIYDYLVKAHSIQDVVTKDIIELNEENRDTIGSDDIYINDIWISGGFLNVDFAFYGNDEVHYINVVKDPEEQSEDESVVYLQVRHNNRDDEKLYRYRGLMSFYIEPLQVEGADEVKIVFEEQEFYKQFKNIELEYSY